jgi:type I restriction enzyme, S subunit
MRWQSVPLADLAAGTKGAIVGGPFGSDLVSDDYVSEGVPVVRGRNLPLTQRFSYDNLVYVSEAKADALHLNCARPGDLVFTQRGTLGQVGLIPEDSPYPRFLISQSQMKMTVDPSKAEALFLYYYFRLPATVANIENHALQAGVPHINLGILRKLQVLAPPIAIQRKFVAILSAYDDLIANNQRRIALLESMAEGIYREWFVRMRFPGHEQVAKLKGIPSTWRIARLGEIFQTTSGGTPSRGKAENFDGEIAWVKTGELKSLFVHETEERLTQRGIDSSAARVLPRHTVVMAMYCAMPDVTLLGVPAATNQACCALLPREGYLGYTYCYYFAKYALSQMVGFAHGAAQQNLSQEIIRKFQVLHPDPALVSLYSERTSPLFAQVEALMRANSELERTRNALLPRLISGKLKVDHLDIQFPPSMRQNITD